MRNLRDALLNSKIYFCVLMLVSMSTLTPLSATTAPPLTIKVVNNSGWEIRRLYLSPVVRVTPSGRLPVIPPGTVGVSPRVIAVLFD